MKRKLAVFLVAFVVAMGLLLGASTAQATEVETDENGNAIRITDLPVTNENTQETTVYNVNFVYDTAVNVYASGFDFPDDETIFLAREAVNIALNESVPIPQRAGPQSDTQFFIGNKVEDGLVVALGGEIIAGLWETCETKCIAALGLGGAAILAPGQPFTYADFTLASEPQPEPEPGTITIGGTVTDLTGIGLVLQNNGSDDLPITADGPFTFATLLTPGGIYNVTVATNPRNPSQICSVTNGSGTVPAGPVTDVTVSCGDPPVGNVSKVAAEGDTLPDPDGTILSGILLEGGVAINDLGEVAFHGQTGSTPAVFTQDGLVAKRGDTLPGDSTVDRIYDNGGVAINLLGEVAFHGRDNDGRLEAAFTQNGLVAKEGDTLDDDTTIPEEISDSGKVAINLFGQVAFHGEIEVEGGLFDETFRAVFTQDGLVTREGDTLTDGTTIVEEISESGGVAINLFGQVAFHGEVDPAAGVDTVAAVFTQDGLVAKEGDTLPEGTIDGAIVEEINKSGGVAINNFGQVAFHGRVLKFAFGADTVRAVFTQDGLVVKEGDTLDDGTILDEISESGGVAINDFGQVAFHGRIGSIKAVFIQDGLVAKLVAKEDDNLTDGTTLDEINDSGGIAINDFGEVAFHGKTNGIDAVFRSGINSPPSIAPAEADLFTSITW
jgi:hypothetical protein